MVSSLPWAEIFAVLHILIVLAAIGYVPIKRSPPAAVAWLLAIIFIPILGILAFLIIGSPFVKGRRFEMQEEANQTIAEFTQDQPTIPAGFELEPLISSTVEMNRQLTALPATTGRMLALYTEYEESLDAMIEEIDKAEHTINAVFYITNWDKTTDSFFQALARAVQRGVTVRFMFDEVGSFKYPNYLSLGKKLTQIGVIWQEMLPIKPSRHRFRRPDLRNHRKLLVVDNKIGFMGSQNLIDSSYDMKGNIKLGRHWNDLWTKLEGPVVTELSVIFAVDWRIEADEAIELPLHSDLDETLQEVATRPEGTELMQLVPSGPGYKTQPNLRMFLSMIYSAEKKLSLISPYFIPDQAMMEAITSARFRGVDVDLYVSKKSDQAMVGYAQASYYDQLLEAGVKIWEWPEPDILHSKFGVADDSWAFMGSSNMDMRSFGLNYEISLMTVNGPMLEGLQQVAEKYREGSELLTLDQWRKRPWYKQYLESVARLSSPLQ